jgi:hypothetical protein
VNINQKAKGETTMTIFTKVRLEHIKRALIWAAQIAIAFANKWWRRNEK